MPRSESPGLAAASRSPGRWGDAGETSSGFILDQMAAEGIETTHIVRMPGLMTPVSAIMVDATGERTLAIYRDPALWNVKLPEADVLLAGCQAVLVESRCAAFCTELCTEARRLGIPIIVGVDRAMPPTEGLLTTASHLLFASEQVQETAGVADDGEALKRLARLTPAFLAATRGPRGAIWLNETGEAEGDTGFRGRGRRYARRRRRLPRRLRASPGRRQRFARGAAIRRGRRSTQMHPPRRRSGCPTTH
ncbi:sugar/nucleoside kinase (ribokinase family) [Bradyrhizobium sp. LM2.7]